MVWLRSALFVLLVPGTVAFLAPALLARRVAAPAAPAPLAALGAVLVVAGSAALLACVAAFARHGGTPAPPDAPPRLVARGLYRFVRNPMYVAAFTILAGQAILRPHPLLFAYAGAILAGFHVFVVAYEEPTLRRRFGPSYEEYLARVPRWIPRPPRAAQSAFDRPELGG